MDDKRLKQLGVIGTALILLTLVGAALFFSFKEDPTCEDGIRNQGEIGIYCGGPCSACEVMPELLNLEIEKVEFAYDTDNRYDVVAKVRNANDLYGAGKFSLKVELFDGQGSLIGEKTINDGFILPSEEKYLVIPGVEAVGTPSQAKATASNEMNWEQFDSYKEPVFFKKNIVFDYLSGGEVGFGKVSGTIVNESGVDFETVIANVLLRDERGKLLAATYQTINTFRADEQRDVEVVFPHSLSGLVTSVEVEPYTNVFRSDNYLRVYGTPSSRLGE